jgi:protein O-GlcNAc transferase
LLWPRFAGGMGRRFMPNLPETLAQAVRLHRSGQPAAAIPLYREILRVAPDEAQVHHQLGNALKTLLRFTEALNPLGEAARLAPNDAVIRLNFGVTLLELHRYAEAEVQFRRAIAIEPSRPEAHNILGNALFSQGRLAEASACFQEALRLRADYAPAHDNLGRLYRAQGRIAEAVTSYRAALSLQPRPGTHSNLLLALNYLPALPPQAVFEEHQRWAARYADPLTAAASYPEKDPLTGRRIRVGYLSPDLSNHAVAYFFEPVLAAHDTANFEIFCYANVLAPGTVTNRLRERAEHWRDIAPLSDEQATQVIRGDRLDVLVDLAGHTARNRLLVFARRAAPRQLTWIGYPNTTGLTAMDYRLTDEISDPAGRTETLHTEKLVRLPGPFSVYQPPADAPSLGPLPMSGSKKGVTFGCFNNFAKVTAEAIQLWSRLLLATPGSRIFLKSRGLDDADTTARIRMDFMREGITPERLILDGRELSVPAHLSLYYQVDVALDTFPYNGTTTTCEALWMGVPVVTLAGETHVARVGASLLTHLGIPEWIAKTPDDYVAIARALVEDQDRLKIWRDGLREKMRQSPLCDAVLFTRSLENTLSTLAR